MLGLAAQKRGLPCLQRLESGGELLELLRVAARLVRVQLERLRQRSKSAGIDGQLAAAAAAGRSVRCVASGWQLGAPTFCLYGLDTAEGSAAL